MWLKELKMLPPTQKGIVDAFERIAVRSKREVAQLQKIQRKLTAKVSDLVSQGERISHPIKKIGVKLKESPPLNLMQPGKRHPTSPIIDESVVIGRETDREKVVGSSTSDGDSSAGNSGIQVVPICDMGGLGKPTLPQPACEEEKLRPAVLVSKSAPQFIQGCTSSSEYTVPEEVEAAGFQICADELGSIVEGHDVKKLKVHGGVEGVANKLATSTTNGITTTDDELKRRQEIHGINRFTETLVRSFWVFVWEALHDRTLIILAACSFISLIVGIATEGWPKGAHDGLGTVASILLVVFVTATSDYRQSLQFKDLDKEKKKITVQVTRNGYRQKISIYELLPGDIVHLAIGDQVPTDGLFISGFSVLINESSLTGECEPVTVNEDNPFLLSGTKVQDGSCKMLVTTVGMRTQWGKLMATLSEGGDDETPLQVKLNGVATLIGKIGLFFAVVTFAVLVQGLFMRKLEEGTHWYWSGDDALEMLEYFAVAVTIVVVAVPEGLPLAVTLSLAFAMKKMMNDKALVRHLAACETMGSATTICSDKTGTLTTNHMTVVKAVICGNVKEISKSKDSFCSGISDVVVKTLLQSIFNNTGGEIVINKDGKREILGTPTDAALLEFGLFLGGDFQAERQESKIVKAEPFNSEKKRMAVVLQLPGGGFRAHCKGASEIVLAACDNVIDSSGQVIPLDEASMNHLKDTIECFASDALRTLCLAYMEIGSDFSPKNAIPVRGYTCIGIVGIKDPVRPGVRESVAICRSAGITVRMVTGDNLNTAKAIARECGILTDGGLAIEGPEFREKSVEEMIELIPKIQVMARSSPLDKHTLVKHLRTMSNEVVAVTGDGTNDAPALHEADIGLAMGIAGTEVAKESADVIILDDNFSTIVAAAKCGRSVYINIQNFVQFQLTLMVVALIVNFSSACLTGHVLLTAVQLLWVNMIKVTLGALALATEPPLDDLMKREPVRRSGGFISNVMWRNILGQSLYQIVVISYLQTRGKRSFQLAGPDADLILNTLIFNIFFFCQVFNEISSREMEKINVFKGMLKNYVFVGGALTCAVAFQVIIIEFLGDFANTTPLTSAQWFLSIFIGFVGIPIAAIIKLIALVSERDCMQAWKASKHYLPLYLPLLISYSLSLSFRLSLPLPFTPSLKLGLSHSPSLSLSLGSPSLSLSFSTEQRATSSSSSASPSSSSPASSHCWPSSSQEPFVPLQHPHHLCNCKTESHAALPDDCANSSRGMCIKLT